MSAPGTRSSLRESVFPTTSRATVAAAVGVFYGEYYDAFRDTAIDFAGSLTGRVIEEQVFVDALGEWVNFRFRGGAAVQDAFFAPSRSRRP